MEEGRIGNNLAPGNIYYFKTTKEDLRRMNVLMDEAKIQGYEMVTLNRLFGYEENEYERVVNVLGDAMPADAAAIRFFAVEVSFNGMPVRPAAPVSVTLDGDQKADAAELVRVKDGAALACESVPRKGGKLNVEFDADRFGAFAVAYSNKK